VTSRDVARAANVSQALVSRAFSGNGRIAAETKDRILRVAAEIGWQPNALAASMVTGDAPLVAVITTRLSFDWRAQVLSHLLKAFEERRVKPLLFYADDDNAVDRLLAETISWRTRGVVVTAGVVEPHRAEAIISRGQFLAALNRPANHPGAFAIATDNPLGGRLAADIFRAEGRGRWLALAGPESGWATSQRAQGFAAAAAAAGVPVEVWNRPTMTTDDGLAFAAQYLALPPARRPDAIFATNDALALGFADGVRDSGIVIPGELSLIGFDNLPSAAWKPYRLTTFEQPLDQMVAGVLDHIAAHRAGEPAAPTSPMTFCPPRLVRRGSTRANP